MEFSVKVLKKFPEKLLKEIPKEHLQIFSAKLLKEYPKELPGKVYSVLENYQTLIFND